MTKKAKFIILGIALLEIALTIGLLALPSMVRALPGVYYVRLQNNPLTAPVMQLITTPLPKALPVAVEGERITNLSGLPQIPGLQETVVPFKTTPTAQPALSVQTTPTVTVESENTALTPTPEPTLTPAPTVPPPPAATLPGLITVRQGFNNCGPANLTIVLQYFGDTTTQEDAAAYLKPNQEDRNVSPWQITEYVNDFTNLRSTVHSGGNLEIVKQLVSSGFPVVIEKGYEPNNAEGWYGHYLTVYGYDDHKQEVYTRDTNLGPFDGSPRVDSYSEFVHWWQQFNYTFYVVYPPDQEETVMAIIPQPLQETISMWEYAVEISRQELEDEPDNTFTWFNLGVSLTRLAENTGEAAYYEEAAVAFDKARAIGLPPRTLYYDHRPFMAYYKVGRIADVLDLTDALLQTAGGPWVEEIHWYRGHALAAQGKLIAARESYEKALVVNPNFFYAQISLDWVNSEINQ